MILSNRFVEWEGDVFSSYDLCGLHLLRSHWASDEYVLRTLLLYPTKLFLRIAYCRITDNALPKIHSVVFASILVAHWRNSGT